MDALAGHLAANVKQLRTARGFTQQQMARLSGLPRATWANLESGSANPTLAVARQGYRAMMKGRHGDPRPEEQAHGAVPSLQPARPGPGGCGLVQPTAGVERRAPRGG